MKTIGLKCTDKWYTMRAYANVRASKGCTLSPGYHNNAHKLKPPLRFLVRMDIL